MLIFALLPQTLASVLPTTNVLGYPLPTVGADVSTTLVPASIVAFALLNQSALALHVQLSAIHVAARYRRVHVRGMKD